LSAGYTLKRSLV